MGLYHTGPIIMPRLVSCPRCGKIHPSGECPIKTVGRYKNGTKESSFRSSYAWTKKALWIKERDHYLCQACLHNLDGQGIRYTSDSLEVHHIKPINSNYDDRLDEYNLITLCREHHEMAEAHHIDAKQLKLIAKSNNEGC